MIILLHSSKTMHDVPSSSSHTQQPVLLSQAKELATYLQSLTTEEIQTSMAVSSKLAEQTKHRIDAWTSNSKSKSIAIESFAGDIYSGLQTHLWSAEDRNYANETLRILSGLYGILKPLDCVYPYRLEMGYKLPDAAYRNLYAFWGDRIAKTLPDRVPIINITAVEYSKVITPFIDETRIVTPRFLTVSPKNGQATFVVVHAKIARGAYANWIITNRIEDINQLSNFDALGYRYDKDLSTELEPVYVCQEFKGLGLSVRLRNK